MGVGGAGAVGAGVVAAGAGAVADVGAFPVTTSGFRFFFGHIHIIPIGHHTQI